MEKPLIMTPGPTYVHEEVRNALAQKIINPDLDPNFFEYYKETCTNLKKILNTKNDVLIFSGEGILGLEAACASLIEPGDRVLCIENGIFGKGFGDFAKMYGAEVEYFSGDSRRAIDINALEEFLKNDNGFEIATLVHCETPSGITNPVDIICPLLKRYGILSIVDSVSAVGGEKLETDKWQIDMVLGGSQKCLSAPPGLTFFSISGQAWDKMINRTKPIAGFYTNILQWNNWYQEKWFPYTQPVSDIYALNTAAARMIADTRILERHRRLAEATRESFIKAGFELYPIGGYSNTVTTIKIPEGITFQQIFDGMLIEHNILIAGAFDFLKDKVFRIGHMGENCYEDKIYKTLNALDQVFMNLRIKINTPLHVSFAEKINSL